VSESEILEKVRKAGGADYSGTKHENNHLTISRKQINKLNGFPWNGRSILINLVEYEPFLLYRNDLFLILITTMEKMISSSRFKTELFIKTLSYKFKESKTMPFSRNDEGIPLF
jgi:hypothetical protein